MGRPAELTFSKQTVADAASFNPRFYGETGGTGYAPSAGSGWSKCFNPRFYGETGGTRTATTVLKRLILFQSPILWGDRRNVQAKLKYDPTIAVSIPDFMGRPAERDKRYCDCSITWCCFNPRFYGETGGTVALRGTVIIISFGG